MENTIKQLYVRINLKLANFHNNKTTWELDIDPLLSHYSIPPVNTVSGHNRDQTSFPSSIDFPFHHVKSSHEINKTSECKISSCNCIVLHYIVWVGFSFSFNVKTRPNEVSLAKSTLPCDDCEDLQKVVW